jgi:hypothetical protein
LKQFSDRRTFIDDILKEQKIRGLPGPAAYQLEGEFSLKYQGKEKSSRKGTDKKTGKYM